MDDKQLKENIDLEIIDYVVYQMNAEYFSAYLYLTLSNIFDVRSLLNISQYFYFKYEEEIGHAEKFRQFILDNGWQPSFYFTEEISFGEEGDLVSGMYDEKTVTEIFNKVLNHEKVVSENIKALYSMATNTGNNQETEQFLLWFIEEQVEEEKEAGDLLSLATISSDYDFNRDILTITGDES